MHNVVTAPVKLSVHDPPSLITSTPIATSPTIQSQVEVQVDDSLNPSIIRDESQDAIKMDVDTPAS